jgi:hypothetical protein
MAFCNACGATLAPGTKFCNKCGAAASGAPVASVATPSATAATPTAGSSALKVILIVVAVIVGIGILGIATIGVIGYHFAKSTHVTQEGDHVKVETPFGKVETSKDPDQAAKEIGVDIYPGAEVQKNGASSTSFGSVHTVTANFQSSDSVDKVCAFYKSRFPGSMVNTSDQNRCTIVSNDQRNMITINVEASGNTSRFQITNVSKKTASSN